MINQSSPNNGNSSSAADSLFASYIDRLVSGEPIDVDQVRAQHPELGDELIEQLRSFCELADDSNDTHHPRNLGDFDIIREIGRGGMGIVYEAWQNSLNRQVALKLLPTVMGANSKTVTRFIREAQVSGMLNHSNIVPVYGMAVEGNTPYYSMEFVDGETLREKLRRMKDKQDVSQLSLRYCMDMANAFAGVSEGLQHAHQKTVVHRDIKPSNLMFDRSQCSSEAPDGELRILDFGLARFEGQDSLTMSGDVIGTVRYMSPEQASAAQSQKMDHRTDIYSLGASLYETVTLRPPLEGKDIQDTLSQIVTKDPVPPKQINPLVPRDLETIILKCLRKEPSERYGTAEALAQDLRRFVRGDAIEARPLSTLEKFTRKCSRHPGRIAACTAITVSMCLAFWLYAVSLNAEWKRRLSEYPAIVTNAIIKLRSIDLVAYDSVDHELSIYPWANQPYFLGLGEVADLSIGIEAEELLTKAINYCPRQPDAYWHRCRLRFLLGKEIEAIEDLNEVIRLSPDHAPALFLKASVLRAKGKDKEFRKMYSKAEKSAAVRDSWQYKWLKAQRAMQAGDMRLATIAYPDAIDVNPEPYIGWSFELRHQLGIALHGAGDHFGAIGELAICRNRWSKALDVRVAEASVSYELGGKGRPYAEQLLEDLYDEGMNRTLTAVIACRQHSRGVVQGYCKPDDVFMDKWINRIDDAVLRKLYRGRYYWKTNRYDAAHALFQEASDLSPDNAQVYFLHAHLLWNWRDPSMPIPLLEKAVELEPDNVKYRAALSFFLAKNADDENGYDELAHKHLSKVPHHSHRRMWDGIYVALALGTLGDVAKAHAIFDELGRVSSHPRIEHNRGEMLLLAAEHLDDGEQRDNLLRESIKANQLVMERYPEFAPAYSYIIRAQLKLGDHKAAVRTYESLVSQGIRLSHSKMLWGAECYLAASEFSQSFELFFQLLKEDNRAWAKLETCSALTSMLDQRGDLTREQAERLVKYLETTLPGTNPEDASRLRRMLDAANRFLAKDVNADELEAEANVTVDSASQ